MFLILQDDDDDDEEGPTQPLLDVTNLSLHEGGSDNRLHDGEESRGAVGGVGISDRGMV